MTKGSDADRFSAWLIEQVIRDARGDGADVLDTDPSGRLWLGTLVSEDQQVAMGMGERGERLDPCAVGVRLQPLGPVPWTFDVEMSCRLWSKAGDVWRKSPRVVFTGSFTVTSEVSAHLGQEITAELRQAGAASAAGEIRAEVVRYSGTENLEITLVNTGAAATTAEDTRLYEVQFQVRGPDFEPFQLESLPDSFRYERSVPAYGINCGVERTDDGALRITDTVVAEQYRPVFWNGDGRQPDLSFTTLSYDPLPELERLVDAHRTWGEREWSADRLDARAVRGRWSPAMIAAAEQGRQDHEEEQQRLTAALDQLAHDPQLLLAFKLMNRSMVHSSRGRYDRWRPFQIAFVLAALPSVTPGHADRRIADVVWFSTGGGKTETYLGLVVLAAFYDRLTGKRTGLTAWSRFPLRLLSLQQTQRFVNAMAGAELVRRAEALEGDSFSTGFFVGENATPNRIQEDPQEEWRPDPEDPAMPARFRVLLECPFCFSDDIAMRFDHLAWRLEHICQNAECPWTDDALPFYVVDDEVYRVLPTVVIGTLDKIALAGMQASMSGFFGPPRGVCADDRHGHVYAPRSTKPNGCLVPGCTREVRALPQDPRRYGPTLRLQDELHLLRDSLGAVDAHYEALADDLQQSSSGEMAKVIGSSATLSGFERQTDVLYRRVGRVFPVPGPTATSSFWTSRSADVARRHVALAPRGSTIEFANDRIITVLQTQIRRLRTEPDRVAAEAGVESASADALLDLFGTDVVYGNTIRDLDAAARSLETQIPLDGPLNTASLTGQTDFEEVRNTLARLESAEDDFDDRVHVVTASSMMSHGVDIDRLNLMVVLGLPLTTAEYIQTTARVGRRWPGAVFTLLKMARERDSSTFRAWLQFVQQGDRFVEPIPITRRSRRVLQRTAPGLLLGRLLHYHEPAAGKALTTVRAVREFKTRGGIAAERELDVLIQMLQLDTDLDQPMREELGRWVDDFFANLDDPPQDAKFPSDLCPGGDRPMRSLRDVEEQAPVRDIVIGGER